MKKTIITTISSILILTTVSCSSQQAKVDPPPPKKSKEAQIEDFFSKPINTDLTLEDSKYTINVTKYKYDMQQGNTEEFKYALVLGITYAGVTSNENQELVGVLMHFSSGKNILYYVTRLNYLLFSNKDISASEFVDRINGVEINNL